MKRKKQKNNICIARGKRSCTCQPACRLSRGTEGRQGITSGGGEGVMANSAGEESCILRSIRLQRFRTEPWSPGKSKQVVDLVNFAVLDPFFTIYFLRKCCGGKYLLFFCPSAKMEARADSDPTAPYLQF